MADGWLGIPADPRLWFAENLPASASGLLIRLPGFLYRNYLTAYMGFPQYSFFSTDYFPLLPWLCLFLCGFFLRTLPGGKERGRTADLTVKESPDCLSGRCLAWLGRHSLLIYMLHQPVIYGLFVLVLH